MTPDRQLFLNYRSVAPNTAVTFVNGQQAAALGEGDVELTVKLNNGVQSILLKNVLHVPEATVNLISTRQAIVGGCQVTLLKTDALYQKVGSPSWRASAKKMD